MKKLYLLRHARAEERQSGQKDSERQLTPIGLQNATRMGINFRNRHIQFDIILTSPADRAFFTASLIAEQLKFETSRIHINDEIYEASVRTLLQVVNNLKDEWNNVLIVGHNPTITYLAEYLTDKAIGNITTCGVVLISFETSSWAEITQNSGELVNYEYPELLNF